MIGLLRVLKGQGNKNAYFTIIHVRIHKGNVKAEEYSEMFHLFASIEPSRWRRGRALASHTGDQGSVPGR